MSSPALIWDAMLKIRKVEFELIAHPDMFIFFEKGARGGIYYIPDRYSKAKNKYLKLYDSKQEKKRLCT